MTEPYRWVLAGVVEHPYYATAEGLMGTSKRGGGVPENMLPAYHIEEKRPFMEGRFQIAKAKTLLGGPLVVVFDGDLEVAQDAPFRAFIAESHRGLGISVPMIAEAFMAFPQDYIVKRMKYLHLYGVPIPTYNTDVQEAVNSKVFNLLLERGAVRTTK
jgi:hypothetical protein